MTVWIGFHSTLHKNGRCGAGRRNNAPTAVAEVLRCRFHSIMQLTMGCGIRSQRPNGWRLPRTWFTSSVCGVSMKQASCEKRQAIGKHLPGTRAAKMLMLQITAHRGREHSSPSPMW